MEKTDENGLADSLGQLKDNEVMILSASTLLGDLMSLVLDELKAMPDVWQKLPQLQQEEVLFRIKQRCTSAVAQAVRLMASGDRVTLTAAVDTVTFKDGVKAVLKMPGNTPGRHDLADAEGETVLIVIPDTAAYMGGELPEADLDQPTLAFESEDDPLYQEAVDLVLAMTNPSISNLQRQLKVGYNRAARMIGTMEASGVISKPDDHGKRTVNQQPLPEPASSYSCPHCNWTESCEDPEALEAMIASHHAIDCPNTPMTNEEDTSQFH
ncbi:DNA translocase FtsK [Endozoicomonas sp. ALE010]|uniref:DNA translocase FtsK n=1 Tax=Endozoicomonas sp. ALE010 TaxID=3403081 RepID=UPI003BB4C338